MDEIKEFLVLEEEEGERLDVYLSSQLGDMSRSYIQKIIKDKKTLSTPYFNPPSIGFYFF